MKCLFLRGIRLKSIFLFLLIFVSFNVFPSSPIENFNTLILKNLLFTQKSLNSITKSLTESNGNITRENSSIFINVNKPYRERYIVKNSSIEIYDFDFDQTRVLQYKHIDNKSLIDIIINGIDFETNNIKDISNNSFKVIDASDREIYIEIIDSNSFFIKFKDNMNITNLVNFKVSL